MRGRVRARSLCETLANADTRTRVPVMAEVAAEVLVVVAEDGTTSLWWA